MSFFNQLGKQPQQSMGKPNMAQLMQMLPDFKKDPITPLTNKGYKIPKGMTDGNQILSYLIQSGQLIKR